MEPAPKSDRGEKTREALLLAAMEVFGRSGYDAASTRAIAKAAGANQALIGYHFGGKHGLYLSVFESIAQRMRPLLIPIIERAKSLLDGVEPSQIGVKEQCVAAIEELQFGMLDILARPDSATWARLVMREQQDPTDAFEILYQEIMLHQVTALCQIIGLAKNADPQSEAIKLQAISLLSQVIIYFMAPATLQRSLGWESNTPQNINTVKAHLRQQIKQQIYGAEPQ